MPVSIRTTRASRAKEDAEIDERALPVLIDLTISRGRRHSKAVACILHAPNLERHPLRGTLRLIRECRITHELTDSRPVLVLDSPDTKNAESRSALNFPWS